MPALHERALLYALLVKGKWEKTDRHTYSMCCLTNSRSPGASEGVAIVEVEEVKMCVRKQQSWQREQGEQGHRTAEEKRKSENRTFVVNGKLIFNHITRRPSPLWRDSQGSFRVSAAALKCTPSLVCIWSLCSPPDKLLAHNYSIFFHLKADLY